MGIRGKAVEVAPKAVNDLNEIGSANNDGSLVGKVVAYTGAAVDLVEEFPSSKKLAKAIPVLGIGADAASVGINLQKGDFAAATCDAIGFIPVIGDALSWALNSKLEDYRESIKELENQRREQWEQYAIDKECSRIAKDIIQDIKPHGENIIAILVANYYAKEIIKKVKKNEDTECMCPELKKQIDSYLASGKENDAISLVTACLSKNKEALFENVPFSKIKEICGYKYTDIKNKHPVHDYVKCIITQDKYNPKQSLSIEDCVVVALQCMDDENERYKKVSENIGTRVDSFYDPLARPFFDEYMLINNMMSSVYLDSGANKLGCVVYNNENFSHLYCENAKKRDAFFARDYIEKMVGPENIEAEVENGYSTESTYKGAISSYANKYIAYVGAPVPPEVGRDGLITFYLDENKTYPIQMTTLDLKRCKTAYDHLQQTRGVTYKPILSNKQYDKVIKEADNNRIYYDAEMRRNKQNEENEELARKEDILLNQNWNSDGYIYNINGQKCIKITYDNAGKTCDEYISYNDLLKIHNKYIESQSVGLKKLVAKQDECAIRISQAVEIFRDNRQTASLEKEYENLHNELHGQEKNTYTLAGAKEMIGASYPDEDRFDKSLAKRDATEQPNQITVNPPLYGNNENSKA